jgi:hypothetical protein
MAQLNVTELDFATIKQNLKTFMQSQEEFQDYNFDGAGLSILLDILAYNTHYNATLAHLQSNEMFIDSAVKRNSVASIAKTLGYTPTSRKSARANIVFQIDPPVTYSGTSLTIARDTQFTARTTNKTYTFYPKEDYVSGLVTLETNQTGFSFPMELIEGKRVSNNFIVDQSNKSGPFVIPNINLDTTTIRVRVQESSTISTVTSWNFYDDITAVDETTRAFFIEEGPSGLYEIRFGDDILGKQLSVGNIVFVDYIVSSGSAPNSIPNFSANQTFTASGETKVVYLESAAAGALLAVTILPADTVPLVVTLTGVSAAPVEDATIAAPPTVKASKSTLPVTPKFDQLFNVILSPYLLQSLTYNAVFIIK